MNDGVNLVDKVISNLMVQIEELKGANAKLKSIRATEKQAVFAVEGAGDENIALAALLGRAGFEILTVGSLGGFSLKLASAGVHATKHTGPVDSIFSGGASVLVVAGFGTTASDILIRTAASNYKQAVVLVESTDITATQEQITQDAAY